MRPISAVSNISDNTPLDHVKLFVSDYLMIMSCSIRMNLQLNQHASSNDTLNYSIIFNPSTNVLRINYRMEINFSKPSIFLQMKFVLGNKHFFSPTIFTNHCRRIHEQLQHRKPIWEGKLFELQNLLKDIASSSPLSIVDTEVNNRRTNLLPFVLLLDNISSTSFEFNSSLSKLIY